MKQGDLVIRKSYGGDVIFKIQAISSANAIIRGVDYRLMADAPVTDLQPLEHMRQHDGHMRAQAEEREKMNRLQLYMRGERGKHQQQLAKEGWRHSFFEIPGKVLHLDGDPAYLRKSMTVYGELRVPAEGFYVSEQQMAGALERLLPQCKPEIVVITGHDGVLKGQEEADKSKLESYKNSQNFVNAVRIARGYERHRDSLAIVAGACQSHFEALLQAGANYASSPARILIHALDPVSIACQLAFTSIRETLNMMEAISHTISGLEGMGGMETRGTFRVGLPGSDYKVKA